MIEGKAVRRRQSFAKKHWIIIILGVPVLTLVLLNVIAISLQYLQKYTKIYQFQAEIVGFIARFAVFLVIACFAKKIGVAKRIKFGKENLKKGLLIGCLVSLVFSVAIVINVYYNAKVDPGNKIVLDKLIIAILLNLSIGLLEEYLMRGIVYETLKLRFRGRVRKGILIVCQATIFAVLHINNYFVGDMKLTSSLKQISMAMVLGVYFGFVYEHSKSLLSVIILHALYDFSLSFAYVYEHGEKIYNVIAGLTYFECAFIFFSSLIVFILSVFYYDIKFVDLDFKRKKKFIKMEYHDRRKIADDKKEDE